MDREKQKRYQLEGLKRGEKTPTWVMLARQPVVGDQRLQGREEAFTMFDTWIGPAMKEWSLTDRLCASQDGWGLFRVGSKPLGIYSVIDPRTQDLSRTNEETRERVKRKAAGGDRVAMKAEALIMAEWLKRGSV